MKHFNKKYKDYSKEVEMLKERFDLANEKIKVNSADIEFIINQYKNSDKPQAINWNQLTKFPLNISFDLGEGITTKKVSESDNSLSFLIKFKEGSNLKSHLHEDCVEKIEVIKGKIYEVIKKQTISENEKIIFQAKETHNILALSESLLKVLFKKENGLT